MTAITDKSFGRYKLQSAIGAGGMGEVFLAEDPELERLVALKILPAEFAENDERVRRFILEAKAVSALNHPNILTIYEIGTSGNSRYIASEYIKGETVRERLKRETLSVSEALDIAVQIASALEAAHEAGIVHRDIKPENIMLRADRLVKVLDFGLAKLSEDKSEDIDFAAELERSASSGEITLTDAKSTQSTMPPSIAVLPFTNLSNDAENEFFCDGLAEELLNSLAKIERLKVAARTSAFSFKGKNVAVSEIGRALKVANVLEGSVRKAGNRLRINVQLVNAAGGYHLWSERYDREIKDIFDVQDEIALAIVNSLKVKLLGEKKSAVLKHYTENTEAYELYLKGRYYHNKYTEEGRRAAIEFYEQAITLEPEYAPPYAGIAMSLGISVYFGFRSPQETISRWRANANRALELDPDSVDGLISHANSRFFIEWHWAQAEAGFRRALEVNPNSADAHCWYGIFLITQNNYPKALIEGRRAVELDPLSLLANIFLGWIYLLTNRPNDAFAQVRKTIEIEPRYYAAYWLKGSIYLAGGMFQEAVESYEKAWALGGTHVTLSYLGCAYALLGKRDDALRSLNQLLEMRERRHAAAIHIARIYSGLGEMNQTFEWLEKAIQERNGEMVFLSALTKVGTGNLFGRNVGDDSRFQNLLHRLGLPQ